MEATSTTPDLLITGGTVIDGTAAPRFAADVRIRSGIIVEIGHNLSRAGEQVLDAAGQVVSPGFVDSHTHLDPTVWWDPLCDPMPQHGVTTVVTGNCSLSLAPVATESIGELGAVFSYIEDMPPTVLAEAVPWTWRTWTQYLHQLRDASFGVNLVPLVGHTPLRLLVMGPDAWQRPATATERTRLAAVLDDCLDAGAFGLSTSLFDADATGRPVPSRLADAAEMDTLVEVLARRDARLQFIPGVAHHNQMLADVAAIAKHCGHHGVPATWNGLFHDERQPHRYVQALEQAEQLQDEGAMVFPQVSPRRQDVRINWAGGMAFYSLPAWHALVSSDEATKRVMLADSAWRADARRDWDARSRTLLRHRELDKILLLSAVRPQDETFIGATLADLVTARGGHASDVLADWVATNNLCPEVVGIGVSNADANGVAELVTSAATVVSNSDAGAHVQMMCAAGDTTLLLTRHVRDRGDLSLEQAIHRLTGQQADRLGIAGRGRLQVGSAADVVVFNLEDLTWQEEYLVHDLPGGAMRLRRPPGGYTATITNGRIVSGPDTPTGALPGRLLTPAALTTPASLPTSRSRRSTVTHPDAGQITHLIITARDCQGDLSQPRLLSDACIAAVEEAELTQVAHAQYGWTPHGATVALILAQSHVVVSTWPEYRLAQATIAVCTTRAQAEWLWRLITNFLRPGTSDIHEHTTALPGPAVSSLASNTTIKESDRD